MTSTLETPPVAERPRRSDAARRRLRRILLLASIPVVVAALLLAGKLASLSVVADAAIAEYDRGMLSESIDGFDSLLAWNPFDPWIAHFDTGTALAANGDLNPAIVDLEKAFDLAPGAKKCDVAVNLSLSWETLGDAYMQQGLYSGAARLYETAKAAIAAAGEGCTPPNAPFNAEEDRAPGDELSDASDRLDQKLDTADQLQNQADAAAPPPGAQDTQDQLDRLGQQNDDAAGEKADQDALRRGELGSGGFSDKPW